MASIKIKYGDTLTSIARANGTSVQALLAANPNIKDPNRIQAGASLNVGGTNPTTNSTPTPQPTVPTQTTVPKAPTIAEKASLIPDGMGSDPAIDSYYKGLQGEMNAPIDERAMRDQARKRLNTQFDSLRIAAAQKIAEERRLGQGRLGSASALQARSGTLGSNFAGAENDQINRDTQDIENSINAETEAKISFLMGESEKDVSAQIAAQRAAKKAGADEYIKYLETRDSQRIEKANNLAKLFAAQGVDVTNLSPEDVKKLETTYGVDLATFKSMIVEKQIEVASKAKTYKGGGGGGGGGGGYSGSGGGGGYGSDLEAMIGNVAAGISSKNQREAFQSAIKNARNENDKISAIAKVVNITGPAREDLTQTAIGQKNLQQAISFVKSGVSTGKLQSGANYIFNVTGNQIDPQLTQLKGLITAAIQPYRSSVTGAAWGAQEEAEYRSLFGSTSDNPATLLTKLENLNRIMTNKRIGIISSYADPLGTSTAFDSFYDNSGIPTSGPGTPAPVAQPVRLKNTKGAIVTVPAANVDQLLKLGYRTVKG